MNKTVLLAVLCSPWSLIAMKSSTNYASHWETIEEITLLKTLKAQNVKNRQKIPAISFELIQENSIKEITELEKGGFNTLPIGTFQEKVDKSKNSDQAVITECCNGGILVAELNGAFSLFTKEIKIDKISDSKKRLYFETHAGTLKKKVLNTKKIANVLLLKENAGLYCAKNGEIRAFQGFKVGYVPEDNSFFSLSDYT